MPRTSADYEDVAQALSPIRDALRERRLTQKWLAEQIGERTQVISFYLLGRRFPREEVVRNICGVLDLPPIRLPRQSDFSRAGHKAALRRRGQATRTARGPPAA